MKAQTSDAEEIAASHRKPERFASIFDRHYPAIRSYLRRRLSLAIADELAAETFVIAFRGRSGFDQSYADARPWLFGIAGNLLRQHRRREVREVRAYARVAAEGSAGAATGGGEDFLNGSLTAQLADALLSLSSGDRDVLFLYACADLSYEGIAQAMGIPTGTVRSRLARARRQVRELLERERAIPSESSIHTRAAYE